MKDYDCPPLGAKPAYVQCKQRIRDLADAISRTVSEDGIAPENHIRSWSTEIVLQLDLLDKIRILEER